MFSFFKSHCFLLPPRVCRLAGPNYKTKAVKCSQIQKQTEERQAPQFRPWGFEDRPPKNFLTPPTTPPFPVLLLVLLLHKYCQ